MPDYAELRYYEYTIISDSYQLRTTVTTDEPASYATSWYVLDVAQCHPELGVICVGRNPILDVPRVCRAVGDGDLKRE